MANNAIGISAGIDTKPLKDALKDIDVNVEKIAQSMDAMVMSLQTGFNKTAKAAQEASKATSNAFSPTAFTKPLDSLRSLNNEFASGKKSVDEYIKELAKMASVDIKPTKATPIQLQQVGKGEMPQVTNIPQLHELLAVNKRIVEQGNLTTDELRQQVNLHDTLKQRAKELLMSDRQREEQQEKINKKKEREAELSTRKAIPTYEGALNLSDKSITERVEKTRQLIKVRENLSSTDAKYSEKLRIVNQELFKLDLANKKAVASGVNLQSQSGKLSNTFDSLYKRMAYYLSVGFAINFVQKMAAVRGEFELQQRSLQAIIQNKDEADKVFAKITALAVKSPFQLRELVGYTKQLAAYRIETEKLYDTTKMLADVSAGLGVDMGRLILAYGQVKSAAVLRGQELRQFTEAGIPIIQALADKFTQLNGRVVSTGEVFEMVSNRMVSFKMVDEIFKDMTQSGGIFYNMQEIQAETLKGKISNLNDAFDIMLNKMGTEYEGALKGSVDAVRYLLENYEDLLTVIKSLAIGFGSFALVLKAQNALLGINAISTGALEIRQIALALRTKGVAAANIAAANSTTLLGKTMGKLVANPYIAIAAALAGLITYLISAANEANKLQKELKEITSESFSRADELVRNFKKLANTIKDAADGTQKQKDALAELKRTYSEYLPYQSLTIDGLKNMKKGYNEVEEAIYAKIKATNLEKQTTAITEAIQPKISEAESDVEKQLKKQNLSVAESKRVISAFNDFLNEQPSWFDIWMPGKEVEKAQQLSKIIQDETGRIIDASKLLETSEKYGRVTHSLGLGFQELGEYLNKLRYSIENTSKENDASFSRFGAYDKEVLKLEEAVNNASKAVKKVDLGDFEFNEAKSNAKIVEYEKFLNEKISEIGKNIKGKMPTLDEVFEFSGKITKAPAQIQEGLQALVDTPKLMNVFNDIQTKIIKLSGEKSLINMKRVFVEISESIGMSMDDVTGFLKDSEVGFDEWSEKIITSYDSSEKEIKQYQKILDDTKNIDDEAALSARALTEERINGSKLQLKFLDQVIIKYGIERKERSKGDGKDETLERLKDQIALIKEVMKAWKQSFDVYGNEIKANEIVTKRFGEQWKHIIPSKFSMDLLMGVDVDTSAIGGLVESLMKGVSDKARQYGKQEQNQIVFDASIDLGEKKLKEFQMELENSLKGYELSVSLEGYGAFGGMVAKMFEVKPQDFATTISTLEGLNKEIMDNTSLDANQRLTLSKKVDDEIAKLQKDNYDRTFKGYNDLLSKYAQYEFRRIKIAEESAKERENIEASYQQNMINDIQKEQLLEAVNKKEKTETAKVSFEEFKGSDTWIQAFDELGNVSAATLNAMMQKMEQFRTTAGKDLDPTQLREYMNTFKKLREEIIERDPFKALGVNIRAANKAQKELQIEMGKDKFKGTAEEYVGGATAENLDIENQLTENLRKQFEISAQIQALKENELPSDYTDEVNQKEEVLELIRQQNIDLEATQSKNRNIIDLSNQMTTGWNNASKAGEKVGSILKTTMSSVKGLADVFGLETDSMASGMLDLGDVLIEQSMAMLSIMDDIKSSTTKAISDVGDTVDAASEGMKSSADVAIFTLKTVEGASVILAVISAALQVATAIANIFVGQKNKKIDEAIEASERRVKNLKYAYDDLSYAVDRYLNPKESVAGGRALNEMKKNATAMQKQISLYQRFPMYARRNQKEIDKLSANYRKLSAAINAVEDPLNDAEIASKNLLITNIELQKQEIKRQIALEESRSSKKRDQEKIDELKRQEQELENQTQEVKESIVNDLLGTDVKSAAEDFANTWIDAYVSGEDTMDAMSDRFDDMIKNMIVKSLASKIVAKHIQKIWDEVEKVTADNKVTADEIAGVIDMKNQVLQGINTDMEAIKPLLDQLGGINKETLSGLQKGIQGITEPTAEALESLLNTIRFEIFTHTTLLSQIANNINMNSAVTSQLVLYASQSYNVLLQMRAWQQSITSPSHKNGGDGLKVFIN